ncbi:Outer membrane protein assembly factor BamD [bioreactor metagenome]|uniref:Outer membrane protein assembly factor BamD n=1 Tax=bioreactor metagenome TaxID=1076179 RepID=A0A644X2Q8_9ZZZZ
MKKVRLMLVAGLFLMQFAAAAQLTSEYHNPAAIYSSASDLLAKEKFGAAREAFQQVVDGIPDREDPMRIESEFQIARCSYELLNNDAKGLLHAFVSAHPESSYSPLASFYLGSIYYRDKNYSKATKEYEKVNTRALTSDQQAEYNFKMGYSYFMDNEMLKARGCFMQVKDGETTWAAPATYYYGHISYSEGQYEVALSSFQKLLNNETFGGVVPYYIAQIYYLQGKNDELISFAPPMLENPNVKRQAEMARMVGDAFIAKKDYKSALPYLEMFETKTSTPLTREDHYLLGYAYYVNTDYQKAAGHFSNIASLEDSLNQNASYHLADCYLKMGNKKYALNCFNDAYRLKFNPAITEDALFNFARLSYELDFHPYNGAIKALQQYLNDFPKSQRAEEARELLVELLMSTGNYKDAIVVIEGIKVKNDRIWSAYQKVNYYHGVELFNSGDYNGALALFNKAITYTYDRKIRSEALFWKGEAHYRKQQYDSAAVSYDMFVKYPASESVSYFARGYYGLGYAQMQRKNYKNAAASFESYMKVGEKDDRFYRNDASLRLADCYYILRDYSQAIDWYDKSLNMNVENMDYALLQKSKCEGVKGNFTAKQNTLSLLFSKYPNSRFAPDACFESGLAYELMNQEDKALPPYNKLITDYPESPLRPKAMLKVGSLYNNMNNSDKAIEVFENVIIDYKGSEDSKQAWMQLRQVCTRIDRLDIWIEFAKDQGSTISQMEQDSAVFSSAEDKFMNGDCETAVKAFAKYIQDFPNGAFVQNAHFYRAECLYGQKDYPGALTGYEYVISQPFSSFTETSLLKAARIYYNSKDYPKAIERYSELEKITSSLSNKQEAQRNIMFSQFNTELYYEAIVSAQKVIDDASVAPKDKNEASAVIARSSYQLNDLPRAQAEFSKLVKLKSSELGAEDNYYLALIEYQNGRYTESEKIVFDLINEFASFEYWVARSFILLSDVYVASGNYYQAKYTLQSVIDNYKGEDLVTEARTKLDAIIAIEKQNEQQLNGNGEVIIDGNNE